jgi:signal transduction histidine kinase
MVLVAGAAVTTMCSALFGYLHGTTLRYEGMGTAMQRTAERTAGEIDISLATGVQLMAQLADSSDLHAAIQRQEKPQKKGEPLPSDSNFWADAVLAAFAEKNPAFKAIKVLDSAGDSRGGFGKLNVPYHGQHKWWDAVGRPTRGTAAISEPLIERRPLTALVFISVPILPKRRGGFAGELHAQYAIEIANPQLNGDAQEILAFLLTDAQSRRVHFLSPPRLASLKASDFRERKGRITGKNSGHLMMELDQFGEDVLAGFAPVHYSLDNSPFIYDHSKKWFVISAIPSSYTMAPVNSLFSQAIGFGGIVLVIVSLVGLVLVQRILKPLQVLQGGVHEIGQGNLECRIDVRSGDEIEQLASEFNRMADRMQRTQEQLQRRGEELSERVNQLRRLQAQLMQSERMAATGELAAQIAHEINNPLGIIKNYVGIAKMLMPEDDQNRENLKIVDQEINRIAGIVRRLLKFAKPGSEELQSVQINQILEELLALLRGQLFRRKIEVSLELSDNLPEVSTSTDQMRQVFLNLIKNAEDAMPEGGTLVVRTRYKKGHVEVEIGDSGCGIPPEDIKNIFEPFYTTKGVKGTGLGLSVSYGIIKNYNGEIDVESEPGVGTTFRIQLPVISETVFQVVKSSS